MEKQSCTTSTCSSRRLLLRFDGLVPVDRVAGHSLSYVAGVVSMLGVSEVGRTTVISSSASWPWSLCLFWEALAICTFMTPFRKQTSPNYSSSKFKETNAADKENTSWECGRPCPLEFWILLWSEINSNLVITYHYGDNVSLWLNISEQCECVCLPHIQGHSGRVHSCI